MLFFGCKLFATGALNDIEMGHRQESIMLALWHLHPIPRGLV
jgi:hypothetical protein